MIDFSTAISQGEVAAQNVSNNFKEVDFVFQLLNNELSKKGVLIERLGNPNDVCFLDEADTDSIVLPKTQRGLLYISLTDNEKCKKAFGLWSQHPDGYPFTIEYLMERTDCWDKEALILRLTSIISSGQFWLKVKELKATNV